MMITVLNECESAKSHPLRTTRHMQTYYEVFTNRLFTSTVVKSLHTLIYKRTPMKQPNKIVLNFIFEWEHKHI